MYTTELVASPRHEAVAPVRHAGVTAKLALWGLRSVAVHVPLASESRRRQRSRVNGPEPRTATSGVAVPPASPNLRTRHGLLFE